MNRMIEKDFKFFQHAYPEAYNFINAAHLRYEFYCFARTGFVHLTTCELKRTKELLNAPAITEVGFKDRDEVASLIAEIEI